MKFLIVCLAIAGCASAGLLPYQQKYQQPYQQPYHHPVAVAHHVPAHHSGVDATAQILRSTSDISPDGHYSYEYETGNGIHAQEAGQAAHSVQGSFGYTSPDGTPIQLTYVADENGFQPQGAHLPVAPATPPHVLRLLDWIAAHPEQNGDDGQYNGQYNGQVHHTGRINVPVHYNTPVHHVAKPVYNAYRHKF